MEGRNARDQSHRKAAGSSQSNSARPSPGAFSALTTGPPRWIAFHLLNGKGSQPVRWLQLVLWLNARPNDRDCEADHDKSENVKGSCHGEYHAPAEAVIEQ